MTEKEYEAKKEELTRDFIDTLDDSQLVQLWNEHCEQCRYDSEDYILRNSECRFNDEYAALEPYDVATAVRRGQYNPYDEWVRFRYDYPESSNNPKDLGLYEDELYEDDVILLAQNTLKWQDYYDFECAMDELNEEWERSQTKERFERAWDKLLSDRIPAFEMANGALIYFNYDQEKDILETGSVCNAGFCRSAYSVELEMDFDMEFYDNLDALYDKLVEEFPELDEECE